MSEPDTAALLREFKALKGEELRVRYGAHGVGIGWKRVGGKKTDTLALIFYVAKKPATGDGVELIPPTLTFQPDDTHPPIVIFTDVVESEPAEFE